MKIGIASDHRGVPLKARISQLVQSMQCEVHDFGPFESQSVDYPDYAAQVARDVSDGKLDRGILICGTGIGMCITANKFTGVRAATCHDSVTAEYSRAHNDANIICLSADQLSDQLADHVIRIFLVTPFQAGRHARRLQKISEIEREVASHLVNRPPQ
ncbi:MAG: putative sugar phosphate isomerase YwlF [Planctomycetota bacterium]|jgi:ribose 5-phosphate isomerase B